MSYSANEQSLYDHLRATLPRFLFMRSDVQEEIWGAFVKIFDRSRQEITTWAAYAQILAATGIWLNQHARDRGTFRQEDETDSALQARLKSIDDAVTLPAIFTVLERIADTAGLSGTFYIIETGYEMAFMGDHSVGGGASVQSYFGDGSALSLAVPTVTYLADFGDSDVFNFTTSTLNPNASKTPILTVIIGDAAASAVTISVPNSIGVTWTSIGSVVIPGNTHKMEMFRGVGTPSSGTVTVNLSATVDNFKLEIVEVSNPSGIHQVKTATQAAGTSVSATFNLLSNNSLGLVYAVRDVNAGPDEEAGWTQISQGSRLGFTGNYPIGYNSSYQAPITDSTPSASSSSSDWGMLAVELGPGTNGDRMTSWPPNSFVILVPPDTDAATINAINEAVRLIKGAGIKHYIEVQV